MYAFFMTTVMPRASTMISAGAEEVGRAGDDRGDRALLAEPGDQADHDRHHEEQRRPPRGSRSRANVGSGKSLPKPSCQRSFQGMKP